MSGGDPCVLFGYSGLNCLLLLNAVIGNSPANLRKKETQVQKKKMGGVLHGWTNTGMVINYGSGFFVR